MRRMQPSRGDKENLQSYEIISDFNPGSLLHRRIEAADHDTDVSTPRQGSIQSTTVIILSASNVSISM